MGKLFYLPSLCVLMGKAKWLLTAGGHNGLALMRAKCFGAAGIMRMKCHG